MSMGQRQAREKSIQRRAALKAQRKQRRRRLRQAGARSGAAVAVTALGLSGLGMAPALAVPTDPHAVADIQPGTTSSRPGDKAALGNTVYFAATTDAGGAELWKSDGTSAGTLLVKDIYPGTSTDTYTDDEGVEHTYTYPNSSGPTGFVALGGSVYFSAYDPTHGRELWRTDGTPNGTQLVKDINPGSSGSMYGYGGYDYAGNSGDLFAVVGNTLYFAARDEDHGQELWQSDGTAAGTVLVQDISPGSTTETYTDDQGVEHTYTYPNSSSLGDISAAGTTLFFSNWDETRGRELWKSDGTANGTAFVKDIYPGTSTYTYTDGQGVEHTETSVNDSSPSPLATTASGTFYFSATDGDHGRELWKSNGTAGGTQLVKDVHPGPGSGTSTYGYSDAGAMVGSTLYFSGYGPDQGEELWSSDGTAAGTALVNDLYTGTSSYTYNGHTETYANSSAPGGFAAVGTALFFSAADAAHGRELWVLGVGEPATGGAVPVTPTANPACAPATTASADAAAKVSQAKAKLKKAKKSHNPAKIKKAKARLKKAKKAAAAAAATQAVSC
ncbi:ELWxxDGT repeat protein [Nocardioides daeguensis]|uniref:Hyalin n=1 Tax=Nocardioides daeguensis TaxID=908359 RepID=A0ABP6UZ19_9ACTN|nr:ELWxxDGT repeat protein [Nocardioides daeguensis]MBV6726993.1 hypothetical protein [Nocardioides daeguensis]MCR1771604.1 hypothetical protein [Nocardioides daeguensis]